MQEGLPIVKVVCWALQSVSFCGEISALFDVNSLTFCGSLLITPARLQVFSTRGAMKRIRYHVIVKSIVREHVQKQKVDMIFFSVRGKLLIFFKREQNKILFQIIQFLITKHLKSYNIIPNSMFASNN